MIESKRTKFIVGQVREVSFFYPVLNAQSHEKRCEHILQKRFSFLFLVNEITFEKFRTTAPDKRINYHYVPKMQTVPKMDKPKHTKKLNKSIIISYTPEAFTVKVKNCLLNITP